MAAKTLGAWPVLGLVPQAVASLHHAPPASAAWESQALGCREQPGQGPSRGNPGVGRKQAPRTSSHTSHGAIRILMRGCCWSRKHPPCPSPFGAASPLLTHQLGPGVQPGWTSTWAPCGGVSEKKLVPSQPRVVPLPRHPCLGCWVAPAHFLLPSPGLRGVCPFRPSGSVLPPTSLPPPQPLRVALLAAVWGHSLRARSGAPLPAHTA